MLSKSITVELFNTHNTAIYLFCGECHPINIVRRVNLCPVSVLTPFYSHNSPRLFTKNPNGITSFFYHTNWGSILHSVEPLANFKQPKKVIE